MTKTDMIIYCHCTYSQIIPNRVKFAVLDAIQNAGIEVKATGDLCELSAKHDPVLKIWAKAESIKIVACYPRAVKWLFHAGQAPLPKEGVEFLNMRVDNAEKIISSLQTGFIAKSRKGVQSTPYRQNLGKNSDWTPWFPVIDRDLCKNCKQCFNFCLFGVYELSEPVQDSALVEVKNPANCKTNCPACARMCPASAIIFPKYSDGPINGDEVNEQMQQNGKTKKDLKELLGDNIYDAIRQRSKTAKRFSKDTELPVMKKLQEQLDIPPEVLASLSPGQMAQMKKEADKKEHQNMQLSQDERDSKKEHQRYE